MNDLINKQLDIKEYRNIHWWIRTNYGEANSCENLKCPGISKTFDWALKKGKKHARNRKNYLSFCRGCHIKYDWNGEKTKRITGISHTEEANRKRSKSTMGKLINKTTREAVSKALSMPVIRTNKLGEDKHYPSVAAAAKGEGYTPSAIWFLIKGINKKAKNGNTYKYAA